MNLSDPHLSRHLACVVLIKVAVIFALWWAFVRDQQVHVDATSVSAAMLQATAASSPQDITP